MAKNNSINNSSSQLTIDPGSSGDSFIQFDINTTGEFRIGVDDTDGDAFIMSQGSALGTNNTYRISSAGEVNLPLTPAFLGYLASNADNVTGDGTQATLGVGTALTEVFDQGSDFTTAGVFTAPITGRYHLSSMIYAGGMTASTTLIAIQIVTSNIVYTKTFKATSVITSGTLSINEEILADMDTADTAFVRYRTEGTTKVVDTLGGANGNSSFGGYLAC